MRPRVKISHDELKLSLRQSAKVVRVAGVGELVQHGDALHLGAVRAHPVHEVGADEPGPAGDD